MKQHYSPLFAALILLPGCRSAPQTDTSQRVTVQDPIHHADITRAVNLWHAGETREAVQLYVTVASSESASERDLVAFELTEAEYAALPAAERDRKLQDWMNRSRDLRRLTRAVLETDSDGGDPLAMARAAERVGRAHATSDRALIAQHTGQAILRGLEARKLPQ